MTLIRKITLKALEMNFRIFADHIEGKKNCLSDSISRLQLSRFFRLINEAELVIDDYPTKLNDEIWPLTKYWRENCDVLN